MLLFSCIAFNFCLVNTSTFSLVSVCCGFNISRSSLEIPEIPRLSSASFRCECYIPSDENHQFAPLDVILHGY